MHVRVSQLPWLSGCRSKCRKARECSSWKCKRTEQSWWNSSLVKGSRSCKISTDPLKGHEKFIIFLGNFDIYWLLNQRFADIEKMYLMHICPNPKKAACTRRRNKSRCREWCLMLSHKSFWPHWIPWRSRCIDRIQSQALSQLSTYLKHHTNRLLTLRFHFVYNYIYRLELPKTPPTKAYSLHPNAPYSQTDE